MTDGQTDAGEQTQQAGDARRPEVGVAGRPVNQPDVIPPPIRDPLTLDHLQKCSTELRPDSV